MPGDSGRPGRRGDPGEGGINSKGTKGIQNRLILAKDISISFSNILRLNVYDALIGDRGVQGQDGYPGQTGFPGGPGEKGFAGRPGPLVGLRMDSRIFYIQQMP